MPDTLESTERISELRDVLSSGVHRAGTHQIRLSNGLYSFLLKIVEDLADGKVVSARGATQELTTQEAANLLGVSRQFLVRLLDRGKIAFHRVGTHRRVYLQDVVSFRSERDRERHKAITQMAQEAVKDGFYDDF